MGRRLVGLVMALAAACGALAGAAPAPTATVPWDVTRQGSFLLAMTTDLAGRLWVGAEDTGVWCYDAALPEAQRWRHYTVKDGLGDDNAYAIACDYQGRLWVGHLNHGVSVFNGRAWRNYDRLTGPLGERVYDIAVGPSSSDVWISSSLGLACYRTRGDAWSYHTRADGLPTDQAGSLAFSPQGALLIGTDCFGVVRGVGGRHTNWGPDQPPNRPWGEGLAGSLINDLLVARDGRVFVATPRGIGVSTDDGMTWRYRRGADWQAKVAGLRARPAPDNISPVGDLLLEDYVTCLAEDESGMLWVGHRQWGYEVVDPRTWRRVYSIDDEPVRGKPNVHPIFGRLPGDYVSAILPRAGEPALIAWYGGGLTAAGTHFDAEEQAHGARPPSEAVPPLPSPARPPTLGQIKALIAGLRTVDEPMRPGDGAYLGEDWTTQGDWVGRYGRQYALLAAVQAPLNHYISLGPGYRAGARLGPHHRDGDSLRHWVHWLRTDNPKTLYSPILGYRRQADWDDHGETHPQTYEGPDLWVEVEVPEGVHRLSFYFLNKDGHEHVNRFRDYLVELKPYVADPVAAEAAPTLAITRVRNFWGGVYQQFLLCGPSKYLAKIAKNSSLNTICQAVMLDKLSGPATPCDAMPRAWMGNQRYGPLDRPSTSPEPTGPSGPLWSYLDQAWGTRGATVAQMPGRLLAYRAALAEGQPDEVLKSWRWRIPLWTAPEREEFRTAMLSAWEANLRMNPELAAGPQAVAARP